MRCTKRMNNRVWLNLKYKIGRHKVEVTRSGSAYEWIDNSMHKLDSVKTARGVIIRVGRKQLMMQNDGSLKDVRDGRVYEHEALEKDADVKDVVPGE